MQMRSTEEQIDGVSLSSRVSRRAFLSGAAACMAVGPSLLRAAVCEPHQQAVLHLATREASDNAHVHTFGLTAGGCTLLGSISVDSLAAMAAHPALPVLYVARDCHQWEDLPRGVIESYSVERGVRPLRLLARSPMALSATGPRSLAVSPCGRHLLVAASTGGAWNAFALSGGLPAPVAIARKETGAILNAHTAALPTPHGLVFSPEGSFAAATDPGSGRMTLLQPLSDGIAVLARCQTPHGCAASNPVWTSDGKYVIVANAQSSSLSVYEMGAVSGDGSNASLHWLSTMPTGTPVTTLLAHPAEPAVFTLRPQADGSRLELWQVQSSRLQIASDTWLSGHGAAFALHAGGLWVATQDRLTRLPIGDLRSSCLFEMPLLMPGAQAMVTQTLAAPLEMAI
jgi:6-phosphogluconolactonase (cycloisomerase 2 family)